MCALSYFDIKVGSITRLISAQSLGRHTTSLLKVSVTSVARYLSVACLYHHACAGMATAPAACLWALLAFRQPSFILIGASSGWSADQAALTSDVRSSPSVMAFLQNAWRAYGDGPLCRRHSAAYRQHMPGFRWASRSPLTCASLCLLLTCLYAPLGQAVTPVTDWTTGIATNYGGPLDGKNPYDPSWGTITVGVSTPASILAFYCSAVFPALL